MTVSDNGDNPEAGCEDLPSPEELFALNRHGQALIDAVQPLLGETDLIWQSRHEYQGFDYESEDAYLGSLSGRAGKFFTYPIETVGEEGIGANGYRVTRDHVHFGDEVAKGFSSGHKGLIIIFGIGDRWRHDALAIRVVIIPDEYPPYMREVFGVEQVDGSIEFSRFTEARRLGRAEVLALSEDFLTDAETALKFKQENPDFLTS